MTLLRLDAGEATLVILARAGVPARILHLGAALPAGCDLAALERLRADGWRDSSPDDPRPLSLVPTSGFGFLGAPGLVLANGQGALPLDPVVAHAEHSDRRLLIDLADPNIRIRIEIEAIGALFRWSTRLENAGPDRLVVHQCAAAILPAPEWAAEVSSYAGRWGNEHRWISAPLAPGQYVKESYGGRTGFEGAAWLAISAPGASEDNGDILALALAWSGASRALVETRLEGVRQIQIGQRLDPGELVLDRGEFCAMPDAFVAFTAHGRNGVRAAFHPFLRARIGSPRKVHFNTWEAAYFDVSAARLPALIAAAAALGAERFVLDDGWFKGRRDDTTSLGDWSPDPERFPDGLAPITAACAAQGLDFGLWVEPEMASPASDLQRAHPDWVLAAPDRARPTQRGQLVLDFSRADVRTHILDVLDRLLAGAPIAYLKWDHNRELFPVTGESRPVARAHMLGVYETIDALRARHPAVEIETCASGGARADLGMLARTERVWASDDVDALERTRIQRDLSLFVPPAMIGAHVGSSPDHTTGRRLPMAARARVALFFHMGIEADPGRLSDDEHAELAASIAFYKANRDWLHSGRFRILETAPGTIGWSVIAPSGERALVLAVRLDHAAEAIAPPLCVHGLDPAATYRVRYLDPVARQFARRLPDIDDWRAGVNVPGALIAGIGLPAPLIHPGASLLAELTRT